MDKVDATAPADCRDATARWPASFGALWQSYQRPLSWFVANILRRDPDSATVADAVQEIITRLYERRDRYSDGYALRTWVYAVARNYCIDRLRQAPTRGELQIPDVHILREERVPGPLEQLVDREQLELVDRLIERLAPADRSILFLRYFEEMSYREIAHIVRRPEGTIRYRIHEIKKRLRNEMEESND
jgi:RNA polymerase sigma-70 factor (ECF subfamily)